MTLVEVNAEEVKHWVLSLGASLIVDLYQKISRHESECTVCSTLSSTWGVLIFLEYKYVVA